MKRSGKQMKQNHACNKLNAFENLKFLLDRTLLIFCDYIILQSLFSMSTNSRIGRVLVLIAFTLPVILFSLLLFFLIRIGGFTFDDASPNYFNFHPLFQLTAFILFPSYSLLFYRTLPVSHTIQKYSHLISHLLSLLLSCIGLYIVFHFHSMQNFPDLKSAHSWLGVMTTLVLIGNILAGSVFYIIQIGSPSFRASTVSIHRWFGVTLYVFAALTSIGGLIEKALFAKLGPETVESKVVNILTLGIALQVMVVLGIMILDHPENIDKRSRKESEVTGGEEGRGRKVNIGETGRRRGKEREGYEAQETDHLIESRA